MFDSMLQLKRAYEEPQEADGYRVLVDRLWPRDVTKEKLKVDIWLKEIAPTTELRKWFGHDPTKWAEFNRRYMKELEDNPATSQLLELVKQHRVITLIYSAKDTNHNQAVVLKEFLEQRLT